MQITITDEPTRRALTFAVWEQTHCRFGDGTNAFYDEARSAVGRGALDSYEDDRVELLRATFRDAERVRAACCGETVDLEIPADVLAGALQDCVDYVRESERFWDRDPAERQRQLETFDAARQLLLTAEAVA